MPAASNRLLSLRRVVAWMISGQQGPDLHVPNVEPKHVQTPDGTQQWAATYGSFTERIDWACGEIERHLAAGNLHPVGRTILDDVAFAPGADLRSVLGADEPIEIPPGADPVRIPREWLLVSSAAGGVVTFPAARGKLVYVVRVRLDIAEVQQLGLVVSVTASGHKAALDPGPVQRSVMRKSKKNGGRPRNPKVQKILYPLLLNRIKEEGFPQSGDGEQERHKEWMLTEAEERGIQLSESTAGRRVREAIDEVKRKLGIEDGDGGDVQAALTGGGIATTGHES